MTNPQDTIARLREASKAWATFKTAHLAHYRAWPAGGIEAMQILNRVLDAAALSVPNHSSVGREELARINKALADPYDGGIWEGGKFNRSDFVTIRAEDCRAILALLPTAPAGVSEDGK